MNAVVVGFQFRAFVNNVFWGGDFAAIVQPGADSEFCKLIFVVEFKVTKIFVVAVFGGFYQHNGQLGHPFAMACRVRGFIINGLGNHLNQRIH